MNKLIYILALLAAVGTLAQPFNLATKEYVDAVVIAVGAGDVVGPGSATDNAVVRFDTTTGLLIQDSGITIDDTGNLSFANYSIFPEIADPAATPAANTVWLYAKDDGGTSALYIEDDAGTVIKIGSGGGGAEINDLEGTAPTAILTTEILIGTGAGTATFASMSSDVLMANTGAVTIQPNAVALATDTTGNYVATIADSGASEVTVANSGTENAAVTLAIAAGIARDTELAFAEADPITQTTVGSDVHFGDGAGTLAGKVEIGGDADQPQLVVEGFSTQTDSILVVQNDADTELFNIDNNGEVKIITDADSAKGFQVTNSNVGTSSTARALFTSADSSGGVYAYPNNYVLASRRDTFGIVANSTASNGALIAIESAGQKFTVSATDTGNAVVALPADSIGPSELDSTTGAYDFGGVTSLEIPNGAAPTVSVTGEIALDTTVTNYKPMISYYDGTAERKVVALLATEFAGSTDDYIMKYDAASDEFVLEADAGAAGGDSITVDTVAVVDPDFASTGDIDFVDTSNTITANLNIDVIAAAEMADADHGDVSWTSGVASVDANAIALATDTTGNYVATIADSGASEVTVANSGTENAAVTLAIAAGIARDTELAFAEADPITQTTVGSDVHFGDGAGTLAGKVEIGGDADQPQLIIEGFSTQTDDVLIIQNDADTEVFTISNTGAVTTGSWTGTAIADAYISETLTVGSGGSVDNAALPTAMDLGANTSLEIPNGAAPTVDATGEIAIDTTITNYKSMLTFYDGTAVRYIPTVLVGELDAVDNHILKYDAATDEFISEADTGGGGGDKEIELQISKAKLPSANPAVLDRSGAFDYLTFNGTTDESASWAFVMPADYVADAEPVVDIHWKSGGVSATGNVEWEVSITAVTLDTEALETASPAATSTDVTDAVPGTDGYFTTAVATIVDANDDDAQPSDMIIISINRDASADTNNDDASIAGLTFTYTP